MDSLAYRNAIGQIESSNNYGSIGPATRSGDRAYGRYQVMGNNIPDWTEKHYGERLTPKEFLANQAAQDAVFDKEFGSYVQKYGNPQDAASMWFSGRPLAQAGNADDLYITTPEYVKRFTAALGAPAPDAAPASPAAAPTAIPQQAIPQAQAPVFAPSLQQVAQAQPQMDNSAFQMPQAPQIYYAPRRQIDLSQLRGLMPAPILSRQG